VTEGCQLTPRHRATGEMVLSREYLVFLVVSKLFTFGVSTDGRAIDLDAFCPRNSDQLIVIVI